MNKFETELEQKCCEAGLRENPVGLSCKERSQHVRYGPVCIAAFLSCCQLSETLTREAREEQLLLGTSEGATEGAWSVKEGCSGRAPLKGLVGHGRCVEETLPCICPLQRMKMMI